MRAKVMAILLFAICAALMITAAGKLRAADGDDGGRIITIGEDRPDLQFVGQFQNLGANSHQYGYLSKIEGVASVFNSDTVKNEATAMFTFSTDASNVQGVNDGPIRVVNRVGTTTIYYHPEGGATFADPASFSAGIPIQVSDYQQQVVVGDVTLASAAGAIQFTTVHLNTITDTTAFTLNGDLLRLGRAGDAFRTHYSGKGNTPGATPSGWFAGYAVGASRDQK